MAPRLGGTLSDGKPALAAAAAVIAIACAVPLVAIGTAIEGPDLAELARAQPWLLLVRSVGLAGAVTAVALLIGVPLGALLGRTDLPWRRVLAWARHVAAALGTLLTQNTGGYQTASRPGIEGEHAAVALIAFTDRAPIAEIAHVLAENRLRVVDGPLPGGFFSVRFEDDATGEEQRRRFDAILARKDLIRAVMTGGR